MNPKARTEGLIVETVDEGLFVVDEERKTAHYLKGPAAFIWQQANGDRSPSDLAAMLTRETDTAPAADVVEAALELLRNAHLLTEDARPATRRKAMSRSQFLAIGAATLLVSISLPTPASAASE